MKRRRSSWKADIGALIKRAWAAESSRMAESTRSLINEGIYSN